MIFLRNCFYDRVLLVLFYFLYLVSSWKAIPDNQSFLFTLVNPSGNEPIKFNPKPGAAAMRCRSDVGPTFGDLSCYNLTVWDPKYDSSHNLATGFICPPKTVTLLNMKTYFAGVSPFQVSELEVFKVYL